MQCVGRVRLLSNTEMLAMLEMKALQRACCSGQISPPLRSRLRVGHPIAFPSSDCAKLD